MSEKQFSQKRQRMEKEIRDSRLVPKSQFLDHIKTTTDNIVINFESFKHGSTEESIEVSNCKGNLKGEKYFENIHENYIPNVKDHVLSTFVTKENGVRVVPNTSLHQNSILKKKRKLLKKHNAGLSTLPERSDNQIKINICTKEENQEKINHKLTRWEIKNIVISISSGRFTNDQL